MKIRFWGVRGSVPAPGPETARYGGNTTCIQVVRDRGPLIVLDCGTGVRALGDELMKTAGGPFDVKLLVTHTHWDHIHGFPFFAPIYVPGSSVDVRGIGPVRDGKSFEQVMRDQMSYSYFPVENTMLDDVVKYTDYREMFPDGVERSFELCDGVNVTVKLTNHPVYCAAYRIEADGRSFVFTGDHEPWAAPEDGAPGDTREHQRIMNHRIVEFCRDADLVAFDTTYTREEYDAGKRGWGHSYFEYNIGLAAEAGVRKMAFTHHDPARTDDELDRLMDRYEQVGRKVAPRTEFFAAREGMEVEP